MRLLVTLLLLFVILAAVSCATTTPNSEAAARVVLARDDLIGGERALGDIGDTLLENSEIRVLIQKPGFSRGFGIYGGSLLDADLRRPAPGDGRGGSGRDAFSELFPSFFVQAVQVDTVRVVSDGKDGGPARVEASGKAGDLLELAGFLNRAVTGSNTDFQSANSAPKLSYRTTYELLPKKRYVTIRFRVQNLTEEALTFPSDEAKRLFGTLNLPTEGFAVPVGDIALFGATSRVFMPGVGFDLRFGLEAAYQRNIDFPTFPGIVTEYVASAGEGVSYGLFPKASDRNYAYAKRGAYEDTKNPVTPSSILVPFAASSFVGLFYEAAPETLAPRASFEVEKYFVVGSGDVGSVLDTILEIKGERTGRIGGQVRDVVTGGAAEDASVLVYTRQGEARRIYTQYSVKEGGAFTGKLPPGTYSARIVGPGRPRSRFFDFSVEEGRTTPVFLEASSAAELLVRVIDRDTGAPLPAKVTAVATAEPAFAGQDPRTYLFDLEAGEPLRATDLVPDDPNAKETRATLEETGFCDDGTARLRVRPGNYAVVASRGPEYDLAQKELHVKAGETAVATLALARVVDTRGWIALDTHVHSRKSIDSAMSLDDRVRSLAAEGVEVPVASDHNVITDYGPHVLQNGLSPYVFPLSGLEVTTLESGHFNGYPLRRNPGDLLGGAPSWQHEPPDALFTALRRAGSLGEAGTIVQANHPRDQILGYFSQYGRNPFTEEESPPTVRTSLALPTGPAFRDEHGRSRFSWNFEALEVVNGKLFWEIRHYRVPNSLPPPPLPATVPPAGSILRNAQGEPAFPGAVDDWFNLLNLGHRFIALGSGDSHAADDEAGQFRTMVYVGDDRPEVQREASLVEALRTRRVVATNGPLVDFWVNDPGRGAMGQTLSTDEPEVTLEVRVTAAPWFSVRRLHVVRNGEIAERIEVPPGSDLARNPLVRSLRLPLSRAEDGRPKDSWFVIEAVGDGTLFPVIRPLEYRPVMLTDAVASLAGPLGLATDDFGNLRPPERFPVPPYAITNPVWVTFGVHPFVPPGLVPPEVQDRPENDPRLLEGVFVPEPERSRGVRNRSHVAGLFAPGGYGDVRGILRRTGHLGGHR